MNQQDPVIKDLFREKYGLPPPEPNQGMVNGLPADIAEFIAKTESDLSKASTEELIKAKEDGQATAKEFAKLGQDIREENQMLRERHDELQAKVQFLRDAREPIEKLRESKFIEKGHQEILELLEKAKGESVVKKFLDGLGKANEETTGGKGDGKDKEGGYEVKSSKEE